MIIVELFLLKLLDNILSTFKTIFLIKNKYLISALFNSFSQFFYLMMIVKITKSDSISSKLIVVLAVFIGSLVPQYISNKLEKDKVWVYDVMPKISSQTKELADQLRECNLPVKTYKGYKGKNKKILCLKVYSQSKSESRMIEELIGDFSYVVNEVKDIKF